MLPQATANARSSTRPRSRAGSTKSGAVLQSQNKHQAQAHTPRSCHRCGTGPGCCPGTRPGGGGGGTWLLPRNAQGFGEGQGSPFCALQPHSRPPPKRGTQGTFVLLQPHRWDSASLGQRGKSLHRHRQSSCFGTLSGGIKKGHFSLRNHTVVILFIW